MGKVSDKIVGIVRPLAEKNMRRGFGQELDVKNFNAELVKIGKTIDEKKVTVDESLDKIDGVCVKFDSYPTSSNLRNISDALNKLIR